MGKAWRTKIDIILEKDPKRYWENCFARRGWALKERYKYLLENISRHYEILEKANTIAYRFSKLYEDIGKTFKNLFINSRWRSRRTFYARCN